jgi:phosphate transport system ATP-binding protein
LKSTSRTSQPAPAAVEITPTCVIAGRSSKRAAKQSCTAVIERLGELIEFGKTDDVFNTPKEKRTLDYITGRFG